MTRTIEIRIGWLALLVALLVLAGLGLIIWAPWDVQPMPCWMPEDMGRP